LLTGIQARYDANHVSLDDTRARKFLSTIENDHIRLINLSAYAQMTTHWTDWARTVLGIREDYITATDRGTNSGSVSATLFQPKGSLIISPWADTELYVSAGRG